METVSRQLALKNSGGEEEEKGLKWREKPRNLGGFLKAERDSLKGKESSPAGGPQGIRRKATNKH